MAAIVHPLLTLLASLTRQELAQQVTYLKAENAILRSKPPERITLHNQERCRLVRHGKKLGPRIKDLTSIVSYSTFRRWFGKLEDGPTKRPKSKPESKPGRPGPTKASPTRSSASARRLAGATLRLSRPCAGLTIASRISHLASDGQEHPGRSGPRSRSERSSRYVVGFSEAPCRHHVAVRLRLEAEVEVDDQRHGRSLLPRLHPR